MARRSSRPPRRYVTLLVSIEWVHAHCVIPDGFDKGQPFVMPDEQLAFFADHYQVRPDAKVNLRSPAEAFVWRRSQLVRPQKWGKSPLAAAFVCNEAVGPAIFTGWAVGGELYRCRDHGCPCGWGYQYGPGEAMAIPWPTPLIQITAANDDQTANTYDALRPMITEGPLCEVIPKVGQDFTRLPNDGRIDTVTSSNRGRLGQRLTFPLQDETGTYITDTLRSMADTQIRGSSALGGRGVETTNSWNPAQRSTGQLTFESTVTDILRDMRQAPPHLRFELKTERRKILAHLYAGSPWVSLDTIEGFIQELFAKGERAQAARFYGNLITAGDEAYLTTGQWAQCAKPRTVRKGTRIVLGFDGADTDDWTALRAETLDGYQFTPRYGPNRMPTRWNPADFGGQTPRAAVSSAVEQVFGDFTVVRMYGDPPYWQTELDTWAEKFGEQTVRRFETYRPVPMHAALERFKTDVLAATLTHDGDPTTATHVANARQEARNGDRYVIVKADGDTQKIDDCMASVLAHEAAGDALAAGLNAPDKPMTYGFAFA